MDFKLVIDSNIELAETPIWDERVKKLYWTDLFSGEVHQYDPATKEAKAWPTKEWIGSAVPTNDPNKIMCVAGNGLHVLDLETGELEFVVDPEPGNDKNRYNDSRCDAKGRVFISSVAKTYGGEAYTPDQTGAFYMVDTDKSVKKIVDGINQYNAMVWNADNTKMYVVDTYNEALLEFDYDLEQGPTSQPRVVISFKDREGMPDGLSIDTEGNFYVCHWSKKISVWNAKFELVKTIEFPVEYVCCGGFAGEDMKDFYVATSKYCYDEEQLKANPGAGGTFVARSEIAGRKDYFYQL